MGNVPPKPKKGKKPRSPFGEGILRNIQSLSNSKYLQLALNLSTSSYYWLLTHTTNIGSLDNALSSDTVLYLSSEPRFGYPYMKPYCSSTEFWTQTYNSSGNYWTFQSVRYSNLYLACGATGLVFLTSYLDDSARWTPTSVSGYDWTIVLQNKANSTLYLRSSPDGLSVNAQPSSSPTTDPLCIWTLDYFVATTINDPDGSNYLNSYNTVYNLYGVTGPTATFSTPSVDGSYNFAVQSTWGGYMNLNTDGVSISEFPATDPGKLPLTALWNFNY
jgi:hypothetical protein